MTGAFMPSGSGPIPTGWFLPAATAAPSAQPADPVIPYATEDDGGDKTVHRCIKCKEPNEYQEKPFTCFSCKNRGY